MFTSSKPYKVNLPTADNWKAAQKELENQISGSQATIDNYSFVKLIDNIYFIEKANLYSGDNGSISLVRDENNKQLCLKTGRIDQGEIEYLKRKGWLKAIELNFKIDKAEDPDLNQKSDEKDADAADEKDVADEKDSTCAILMPYLGSLNLQQAIDKDKPNDNIFNSLLQAAYILQTDFHSKRLAHGDFNLKNMIINENKVFLIDPNTYAEKNISHEKLMEHHIHQDNLSMYNIMTEYFPDKISNLDGLLKKEGIIKELAAIYVENLSKKFSNRDYFFNYKEAMNLQKNIASKLKEEGSNLEKNIYNLVTRLRVENPIDLDISKIKEEINELNKQVKNLPWYHFKKSILQKTLNNMEEKVHNFGEFDNLIQSYKNQ